MTGTGVTLVLIGCWVGVVFGAKTWEVPTTDLRDHINRDLDQDWMIFLKTYNKTYSKTEELTRRFFWEDSLQYIGAHNLRYDRGEVTYYLGENQFADMADDEFEKIYNRGIKIPDNYKRKVDPEALTEPAAGNPTSIDWRTKGLVSSVKDQGLCGACWAFAAVGALEGQYKKVKKTKKVVSLSVQNLVDCADSRYRNNGCSGGWANNAFDYIRDNRGIDSDKCYPYKEREDLCVYKSSCNSATATGYKDVAMSELALKTALANVGPIAIAMDTNDPSFRFYKSGIYFNPYCSKYNPDHAMLATGYGVRNGREYWTVKNSYGTSWGEKGYFDLSRGDGDPCGITVFANYPVVK